MEINWRACVHRLYDYWSKNNEMWGASEEVVICLWNEKGESYSDLMNGDSGHNNGFLI